MINLGLLVIGLAGLFVLQLLAALEARTRSVTNVPRAWLAPLPRPPAPNPAPGQPISLGSRLPDQPRLP
jgi:hypothetical protein